MTISAAMLACGLPWMAPGSSGTWPALPYRNGQQRASKAEQRQTASYSAGLRYPTCARGPAAEDAAETDAAPTNRAAPHPASGNKDSLQDFHRDFYEDTHEDARLTRTPPWRTLAMPTHGSAAPVPNPLPAKQDPI